MYVVLFFAGTKNTDKTLKKIFDKQVLNIDEVVEDGVVYNLEVLKKPDFRFAIPIDSKVKNIFIRGLRFNTPTRKIFVTETLPKSSVQEVQNDIIREY